MAQLLPSMPVILEVFLSELVGTIAEEKEVDKIVAKTKEAKSSKAYDCMEVSTCFTSTKAHALLVQRHMLY